MKSSDLLEVVREAATASDIEAFVRGFTSQKTTQEISLWNDKFIHYVPAPDSESWQRLVALRNKWAPDRHDIIHWADVLDLDEGRDVPLRTSPGRVS